MKTTLTKKQKGLRKKILEISYKNKYSHLGSCLSCIDLISVTYEVKKKEDNFVLSNGHAGVALYAVLVEKGLIKNSDIHNMYIHPDRDVKKGIYVSTGSLGQGFSIALGMALADKKRHVYCLISDGEGAEGSIWESLRIGFELSVKNLTIILNANGWGGYDPIPLKPLFKRLKSFGYGLVIVNGHDLKALKKAIIKCKDNM